jgi:hypothetical protein
MDKKGYYLACKKLGYDGPLKYRKSTVEQWRELHNKLTSDELCACERANEMQQQRCKFIIHGRKKCIGFRFETSVPNKTLSYHVTVSLDKVYIKEVDGQFMLYAMEREENEDWCDECKIYMRKSGMIIASWHDYYLGEYTDWMQRARGRGFSFKYVADIPAAAQRMRNKSAKKYRFAMRGLPDLVTEMVLEYL